MEMLGHHSAMTEKGLLLRLCRVFVTNRRVIKEAENVSTNQHHRWGRMTGKERERDRSAASAKNLIIIFSAKNRTDKIILNSKLHSNLDGADWVEATPTVSYALTTSNNSRTHTHAQTRTYRIPFVVAAVVCCCRCVFLFALRTKLSVIFILSYYIWRWHTNDNAKITHIYSNGSRNNNNIPKTVLRQKFRFPLENVSMNIFVFLIVSLSSRLLFCCCCCNFFDYCVAVSFRCRRHPNQSISFYCMAALLSNPSRSAPLLIRAILAALCEIKIEQTHEPDRTTKRHRLFNCFIYKNLTGFGSLMRFSCL